MFIIKLNSGYIMEVSNIGEDYTPYGNDRGTTLVKLSIQNIHTDKNLDINKLKEEFTEEAMSKVDVFNYVDKDNIDSATPIRTYTNYKYISYMSLHMQLRTSQMFLDMSFTQKNIQDS